MVRIHFTNTSIAFFYPRVLSHSTTSSHTQTSGYTWKVYLWRHCPTSYIWHQFIHFGFCVTIFACIFSCLWTHIQVRNEYNVDANIYFLIFSSFYSLTLMQDDFIFNELFYMDMDFQKNDRCDFITVKQFRSLISYSYDTV